MDLKKLQQIVVSALEDIKGRDIEVLNTTKLTSLFDRIVIASGDSNRQVRSLARNVHDKVAEAGGEVLSMEGEDNGEWVLVDYNLEELWSARPTARSRKAAADAAGGEGSAPE
jgi:ribosome-associated protein